MTKILHVYKTFYPETIGGVEQYIYNICKATEPRGISHAVLCTTNRTTNQQTNRTTQHAMKETTISTSDLDGIKVIKYPATLTMSSCPVSLSMLMHFRKEAEQADIIHYHYPWPFAYLLLPLARLFSLFASRRKTKPKTVITYHSDIVRQKVLRRLLHPLDQHFLHKADKIIATSPQYAALSPNLRKFASKTEVIPITISRTNYPKPNLVECDAIRKRFGKFFLFIGQLRHYKGLDALIEAMKQLASDSASKSARTKSTQPNKHTKAARAIHLVIIGDGDAATRASLELRCMRYHAKTSDIEETSDRTRTGGRSETSNHIPNVTFLGNVSDQDKVNYLQACFGVILPSNSKAEAFGISLLEGAMFQKPLISCSIGTGVEFVNKHLETGLVVPPTAADLKAAMLKLSQSPKLAERMGAKALERFETLFNYDVIGRQLAELYKKLL